MKNLIIPSLSTSSKLKLQSKKLKSGKVQVKFSVISSGKRGCYGYVLTEAETTLKEVVKGIELKVQLLKDADQYYHQHLYSLNKSQNDPTQFLIFRAN